MTRPDPAIIGDDRVFAPQHPSDIIAELFTTEGHSLWFVLGIPVAVFAALVVM